MPDLLISVVTILDDKFKLDLKPILTMQHKGSRRRTSYSLSQCCVSLSPQCWCTSFGDWTAINNFDRDKESTRRKKTAFGLSVQTIFVWDCSYLQGTNSQEIRSRRASWLFTLSTEDLRFARFVRFRWYIQWHHQKDLEENSSSLN